MGFVHRIQQRRVRRKARAIVEQPAVFVAQAERELPRAHAHRRAAQKPQKPLALRAGILRAGPGQAARIELPVQRHRQKAVLLLGRLLFPLQARGKLRLDQKPPAGRKQQHRHQHDAHAHFPRKPHGYSSNRYPTRYTVTSFPSKPALWRSRCTCRSTVRLSPRSPGPQTRS